MISHCLLSTQKEISQLSSYLGNRLKYRNETKKKDLLHFHPQNFQSFSREKFKFPIEIVQIDLIHEPNSKFHKGDRSHKFLTLLFSIQPFAR